MLIYYINAGKIIKNKKIKILKMKTNYGIFALLMSTCTVQSTKMNHIDTIKPLIMAQMEAKAGSQFILGADGLVKSQSVALDLDTLVSLWGADLKTNWM